MDTWTAKQIVWSNGAYAGKKIRVQDTFGIQGTLRSACASSTQPGRTMLSTVEHGWIVVDDDTKIEVA